MKINGFRKGGNKIMHDSHGNLIRLQFSQNINQGTWPETYVGGWAETADFWCYSFAGYFHYLLFTISEEWVGNKLSWQTGRIYP